MRIWLFSGAALLAAAPLSAQPAAPNQISSTLQPRLAALAHSAPARVGIAAIDLTNGEMVSVNGADRFPMASTVKVAIAAAFLHQVQLGRQSLDRVYSMAADERRKASRIGNMRGFGRTASGADLIDLMLTRSDNSAADILLGAVGGTVAVGEWLHQAGVTGQRVDRSIADLLSAREVKTRVEVGRKRHKHWITVTVPKSAPVGDVRDSSTPEAMATLLAKLRSGDLLDSQHTAYLFDVMARCRTGAHRLKAMLPGDALIAHKTGTLDGVSNDVGIISLPNGHELAVAVFEQGSGGHGPRDRNIAQLGRMLYDGFGTLPIDFGMSEGH
ncbi:beta-lactamase class A [Sphingomonas vulcanisoli]|uniref:Beta-lactamase n=1 Tax=Sphingomonas vulcanisoli TaxID=1658060 RepID=A0ABX0TT83_9SPHN|nr:class A beta-lactamase [Sphingomonas vulcanisoli]NIJ08283.1 beta-lactamase class A [Sphingomonas vulcanisoli]